MKRFVAALAAAPLFAAVAFAETSQLAWDELVDQSVQDIEDPFANVDYDNIERLARIVRLRDKIETLPETDDFRVEAEAKVEELDGELAAQGIDADWLISQRWIVAERRKRAAMAGNPAVEGREIAIAGFAIPAPDAEDGTGIVYLVPERGMCSHIPPPPGNQMIRARVPDGWAPAVMHEPVRLTGQLSIAPSEHVFRIVDGPVPMNATFLMEVAQVETLEPTRDVGDQSAVNEWAAGIAEKLRASGHLPAKQSTATE